MISVVVPIFNERENLPELRRRLTEALDATGHDWEAVLVDEFANRLLDEPLFGCKLEIHAASLVP